MNCDYPQIAPLIESGSLSLIEGTSIERDTLLSSLVPMILGGSYLENNTDQPGPLCLEGSPFPAIAVFDTPDLAQAMRLPLALPVCVREYEATDPGDRYPLRWTSDGVDHLDEILRGTPKAADSLDAMFPVCLLRDQHGGLEETLDRAQEQWRRSPLSRIHRSKQGRMLRAGLALFARMRTDSRGESQVSCWLLRRRQLEEDPEIWEALSREQKRSPMSVLLFKAESERECEAVGRVLIAAGIRFKISSAESAFGALGAAMAFMGHDVRGFALSVPEPQFKRAESAIEKAGFKRNA